MLTLNLKENAGEKDQENCDGSCESALEVLASSKTHSQHVRSLCLRMPMPPYRLGSRRPEVAEAPPSPRVALLIRQALSNMPSLKSLAFEGAVFSHDAEGQQISTELKADANPANITKLAFTAQPYMTHFTMKGVMSFAHLTDLYWWCSMNREFLPC